MTASNRTAAEMDYGFVGKWIVASVAGALITGGFCAGLGSLVAGPILFELSVHGPYVYGDLYGPIGAGLVGLIFGAIGGALLGTYLGSALGQRLFLRRHGSGAGWWVAASTFGFVGGDALGFLVARAVGPMLRTPFGAWGAESTASQIPTTWQVLVFGAVVGACVGLCQWLALRRAAGALEVWLPVNLLSALGGELLAIGIISGWFGHDLSGWELLLLALAVPPLTSWLVTGLMVASRLPYLSRQTGG